jgi:hypothetical protein
MEVYRAKVDDKGEPAKDASGRLTRTPELVGTSGQPQPNLDTKPCFQCHKPMAHQDFVFSLLSLAKSRN